MAVAWRGSCRPSSVSGAHIVMCVSAPVPYELQGEGGDPRAERSHAVPPPLSTAPKPQKQSLEWRFPCRWAGSTFRSLLLPGPWGARPGPTDVWTMRAGLQLPQASCPAVLLPAATRGSLA